MQIQEKQSQELETLKELNEKKRTLEHQLTMSREEDESRDSISGLVSPPQIVEGGAMKRKTGARRGSRAVGLRAGGKNTQAIDELQKQIE